MATGTAGAEDWAFHSSIYRASGNPLLLQMLNGVYDTLHAFFESPPEQALFADSLPLHRDLFNAISQRDSEAAEAICHQILDITERDMRDVMSTRR